MRARLWMVAAIVLVVGGCRTSACGDAYVQSNGRCLDPKAVCDVSCGEHEVCDITVFPHGCNCATGYAGDPCVWTGDVVNDPSFRGYEDEDGEAFWVDEGGQVIPDALGSSGGDRGEGLLRPAAICNAGSLTQVIEMPTYESAEPLVVEVVYKANLVRGAAVGFDNAWTRLPPTGEEYRTETFCLGEAAYWRRDPGDPFTLPAPSGGPVMLRVSASEREVICNVNDGATTLGEIRIDRLVIRPPKVEDEGPCPEPADPPELSGTINGEAESDGGGWEFDCHPAGCVEGGFGSDEAASGRPSVARISREAGEQHRQRMTLQVSVPLPTGEISPALSFWWSASNDRLFPVEIGRFGGFDEEGRPDRARRLETLIGAGGGRNHVYCLPPWTHGAVVDLSFALPDDGLTEAVELAVDDVGVVSVSGCGDAEGLLDPGFESAPNRWMGSSLRSIDQRVAMKPDPALARNGSGVLELSYQSGSSEVGQGADLSMETYVLVPSADDTGGPAVALHANTLVEPSATAEWVLGREARCKGDLPGGGWKRTEICLPPEWSGRWYRLQVNVEPSEEPGMSEESFRVLLDDFELLTSASCASACP